MYKGNVDCDIKLSRILNVESALCAQGAKFI